LIIGLGVDIAEVGRIKTAIERHGETFLRRLYTPAEREYCTEPGHFGPHNLHENRAGSFQSDRVIFATYQNAGLRVFDIADPFRPREVGFFKPDPPPGCERVSSNDVTVDGRGLIYLTDRQRGVHMLESLAR